MNEKQGFLYTALDFIRTIIICFVLVFLCTTFLFKPVHVEGDSMAPTLKNGQYGFSNVFSILSEDYERFDIVVVKSMDGSLWVKRIIGLPGETISYNDDKLYINGEYVEEPFLDKQFMDDYTAQGSFNFTDNISEIQLKEDEIFVMGDNRPISKDSEEVGPFNVSDLVSKSIFVYYPFDSMGSVK